MTVLGFSVDSGNTPEAIADLDKIAPAAGRAESALENLGSRGSSALGRLGTTAESQIARLRKAANDAETLAQRIERAMNIRGAMSPIVLPDVITPSAQASMDVFIATIDRTRSKFVPLYAETLRYRQALDEIAEAQRTGVLTTSEATREIERQRLAMQGLVNDSRGIDSTPLGAQIDKRANVRWSGGFDGDAKRSADAFASSIDEIKSKFVPMYAEGQRYKQLVGEIRDAHAAGVISTDQMTAAIQRERNTVREINDARLSGNRGRMGEGRGVGAQGALSSNLMYQFQDIGVTAAMGMSPAMIALQQGTQIGAAMTAAGSAREGLAGLKGALTSLLSITNLAAIGFTFAGAAAIQWFSSMKSDTKTVEQLLKEHTKTVQSLGDAYGSVATQAGKAFKNESLSGFNLATTGGISGLRLGLAGQVADLSGEVGGIVSPGKSGGGYFSPDAKYKPFADAIEYLRKSAREGTPDLLGFRRMVEERWALDPNNKKLTEAASKLRELSAEGSEAAKVLRELEITQRLLFDDVGPTGTLLSRGRSNNSDMGNYALLRSQQEVAERRRQESLQAQLLGMRARSPAELADAARAGAASEYNDNEGAQERRDRIATAAKMALVEAEYRLGEARRERSISMQRSLQDQQNELSLIGKTRGESERLGMEYRLTQEIKQEAVRNNIRVDEEQIRIAKDVARAYGEQADAIAKTTLVTELAYERRQLLRTPTESAVASRLRGMGIEENLDSVEAGYIRQNLLLERQKDIWTDISGLMGDGIDRFVDSALDGFDDIRQTAGNFVRDLAREWLTLSAINPIKNSLFGSDLPTDADIGGIGGILRRLANGGKDPLQKIAPLPEAVGAMTVSAASVVVNGLGAEIGGDLGKIFSGKASSLLSAHDTEREVDRSLATAVIRSPLKNPEIYRTAIGNIESRGSGDYSAVGPTHPTLGPALGRYGIMQANVGPWSKDALGRSVSVDTFMKSPALQDAVFDKRFGGYVGKYGEKGAAQAWFGGEGSVGKTGRADVLGTTVGGYGEKFQAEVDRMSRSASVGADMMDRTTKSVGTLGQGAQSLGSGLGSVADKLNQFPVAPAAATGGGGIGGFFKSLFGGGGGFSPADVTYVNSHVGLFSDGGYTGDGGRDVPAGVVHRGEVVWSQSDVRRSGGVAAVEAYRRRGLPGYADGGLVSGLVPMSALPSAVAASSPSGEQAAAISTGESGLVVNVGAYAPVYNVQGQGQDIENMKVWATKQEAEFHAKVIASLREAKKKRII